MILKAVVVWSRMAIKDLMWETHKKSNSHSRNDVCKHLR